MLPASDGKSSPPKIVSTLFNYTIIDEEDEFEKAALSSYRSMTAALDCLSSQVEKQQFLLDQTSSSFEKHAEYQQALFYGILRFPKEAPNYFIYLNATVRDGFALLISRLKLLTLAKFSKLQRPIVDQVLWLSSTWIEHHIAGMDAIVGNLLRHVRVGDHSALSLSFAESLVRMVSTHRDWLLQFPLLVPILYYSVVRLINDHAKFPTLRALEMGLVLFLLEHRWMECVAMGRDAIRALQEVSRHPEIAPIWHKMLTEPRSLHPSFTGLPQILSMPSSKKALAYRLSPEMEAQLLFTMEHVRLGAQKRYQHWFAERFLAGPESEALVVDLVRYICCVYHPSNAVLGSGVVPRWAVIGWLLKCIKSPFIIASAKLALYYDWMFYSSGNDSIMNIGKQRSERSIGSSLCTLLLDLIEPGILVITNSVFKYMSISSMLLEFLRLISLEYFPKMSADIKSNIIFCMRQILEKGVIGSLDSLYLSPSIGPELKLIIKDLFEPFLPDAAEGREGEHKGEFDAEPPSAATSAQHVAEVGLTLGLPCSLSIAVEGKSLRRELDVASSEQTASPLVKRPKIDTAGAASSKEAEESPTDADNWMPLLESAFLDNLSVPHAVAPSLLQALADSGLEEHFTSEAFRPEESSLMKTFLGLMFSEFLKSQSAMESSLTACSSIVNVCERLCDKYGSLSAYLLYMILATKGTERLPVNAILYRQILEGAKARSESVVTLARDCEKLLHYNAMVFHSNVPFMLVNFDAFSVGDREFVTLLFRDMDPTQAQTLEHECGASYIKIFSRKFLLTDFLSSTLNWESYQQIFMWQLLVHECLLFKYQLSPWIHTLIGALTTSDSEAMHGLTHLLRSTLPVEHIVFRWLTRTDSPVLVSCIESFYMSILRHWMNHYSYRCIRAIANAVKMLATTTKEPKDFKMHTALLRRLQDLAERPLSLPRMATLFRSTNVFRWLKALFTRYETLGVDFPQLHTRAFEQAESHAEPSNELVASDSS